MFIWFWIGGLDHDVVSNALLCFNTLTNEWTIKLALLTARADHAMVTYKVTRQWTFSISIMIIDLWMMDYFLS